MTKESCGGLGANLTTRWVQSYLDNFLCLIELIAPELGGEIGPLTHQTLVLRKQYSRAK